MTIELVTGVAGVAHVDSADVGAYNARSIGIKSYFLTTCTASIGQNNSVILSECEILAEGRHVRIIGSQDITIEQGSMGKSRIDYICLFYDKVSGIETIVLRALKGTPTTGTPSPPSVPNKSILNGDTEVYIPLFSVKLTNLSLETPINIINGSSKFFPLAEHKHDSSDFTGTLPISKGGTGASSASAAIDNLGGVREIHLSSTTSLSYEDMAVQIHLSTPSDHKIYVGSFNNNGTIWGWIGQNCGYGYDWYEMLRYDYTSSTGPVRVGATLCNGAWYVDEGKLGIARGGTGASTAEGARTNIGAAKLTRLWNNQSPGYFSPQTVTVTGKSTYNLLLIYIAGYNGASGFNIVPYPPSGTGAITLEVVAQQYKIAGRQITSATNDSITFGHGYVCSAYGSVSDNDYYGTPMEIWGMKV